MRRIHVFPLVLLCATAATAQKLGTATVKSLAVSNIVGSETAWARVDLTEPATQRVPISFVSSNPHVALAPTDVIVPAGQSAQGFGVKTEPVASPTTVTLTARVGSSEARATFTVTPPSLSILDCEPKSLPGGSHATCKAWMDGIVGATDSKLSAYSSNGQVAYPAQSLIPVPAGSRTVSFDVRMGDLPQTATATISASYGGVTKTSNLSVTPAAIRSFGCIVNSDLSDSNIGGGQCFVTGGNYSSDGYQTQVVFIVRLTAPAPPSGYKIPLTLSFAIPDGNGGETPAGPFDMNFPKTLEVQAGKDKGLYTYHTDPVAKAIIIKMVAKDPITNNTYPTELTVYPTHIKRVWLDPQTLSAVPLGGQDVTVFVEFKSYPPESGIPYDVAYAGTTDIKGPQHVSLKSTLSHFKVHVSPCAVNPPCHVSATLGGQTGSETVNH